MTTGTEPATERRLGINPEGEPTWENDRALRYTWAAALRDPEAAQSLEKVAAMVLSGAREDGPTRKSLAAVAHDLDSLATYLAMVAHVAEEIEVDEDERRLCRHAQTWEARLRGLVEEIRLTVGGDGEKAEARTDVARSSSRTWRSSSTAPGTPSATAAPIRRAEPAGKRWPERWRPWYRRKRSYNRRSRDRRPPVPTELEPLAMLRLLVALAERPPEPRPPGIESWPWRPSASPAGWRSNTPTRRPGRPTGGSPTARRRRPRVETGGGSTTEAGRAGRRWRRIERPRRRARALPPGRNRRRED